MHEFMGSVYIDSMSGAFGHIMHPYEDVDLTVGELRRMLSAVATGNVTAYEKFDGVNLMLCIDDGEMRFARSAGELRNGGFELDHLLHRFSRAPIVGEVLHDSMERLSTLCRSHGLRSSHGWCSIDVISGRLTNVVKYDHDAIVVHPVRVAETGLQWNVRPLSELYERFIVGPRAVQAGINAVHALTDVYASLEAFPDDATLRDVYTHELVKLFRAEVMDDAWMANRAARRIMKTPGHETLTELKKHWLNSTKVLIGEFVNDSVRVQRLARRKVERTVREFAVRCLMNVHSCLIAEPQLELKRRRAACFLKINELTARGESRKHEHDVEIIGDLDDLTTTVEGIVFQWTNGKLYKLTGLFKHMNQVMGSGRYARTQQLPR